MKKVLTILMAILMLCSMVVFASAAGTTCEGKGFTIVVPDGYKFESSMNYGEFFYRISSEDEISTVDISIDICDDAKATFEEHIDGDKVVTFAGRPALVDEWGFIDEWGVEIVTITTYNGDCLYEITCEGDTTESYNAAYKIAKTIKFTDVKTNSNTNTQTNTQTNITTQPNTTAQTETTTQVETTSQSETLTQFETTTQSDITTQLDTTNEANSDDDASSNDYIKIIIVAVLAVGIAVMIFVLSKKSKK